MKILFCGGLSCGGAEHQMVIIAKQLSLYGHKVFFVTNDTNAFYGEELKKSNVHIIAFPRHQLVKFFKLVIPYNILFLFQFVKKNNIEVGISFLGDFNFANCIVAMLMHGKYKAITGLRNAREKLMFSKRERFYAKFEKYASLKVCNSDNAKNMYAKYYPAYLHKLITIYNIVLFPSITLSYEVKRNNKTHFIIPASYRDVKNPYGLLDALSLMTEKEKQLFDITWYGETYNGTLPYFRKLKNEIQKQNLQDIFILKDATTDIANKIMEADIVALFSSSEGLPNAICEGMILKKPIVMTKVSDYNILCTSNGLLCDWNDALSIKDVILQMASKSNKDLIEMGEISAKKANRLFSEKVNIEKWNLIIQKNN